MSDPLARPGRPKRRAEVPKRSTPEFLDALDVPMRAYVMPVIWTAVIAAVFYLLSNPLVFIQPFARSLLYAILITTGACVLLFPWLRRLRLPYEVLVFLFFCVLSSEWSIRVDATFTACLVYAAITALALVIGANASRAVLVEGMAWGGVVIVLLSWYAYAHRLTGSGVPDSIGVLAGVGTNRNILGYTLVLALAAAVSDLPRPAWRKLLRAATVATILVGIYLSGSATGLFAAGVVLVVAAALVAAQRWLPGLSPRARRTALIGGVVAFVVGLVEFDQIAGLLGRDSSLSGRVPLWEAIMHVTEQEGGLWFGFGWGAVWQHPWLSAGTSDLIDAISAQAGAVLPHGHNSVFDLIPQVGLVGTALALVPVVRAAVRGGRFLGVRDTDRSPERGAAGRFLLLGVVAQITLGLTEPLLTIPLGWFCVVLLAQLPSEPAPVRREEPVDGVAAVEQ